MHVNSERLDSVRLTDDTKCALLGGQTSKVDAPASDLLFIQRACDTEIHRCM
jgi:hypothetical protein